MALQQQAAARFDNFSLVPPDVSAAATRYQAFREIEAEHLALMAQHNLSLDWTPEVRQIVFNAGDHVRHARDARMRFRKQIREFVVALRDAREPLSAVLRHTRSMLQLLETSGALRGDGGWLEAEVLEWAIEEYETATW